MKELCSALAKAFPEIGKAIKDSKNPFYKSKYADLESVTNAIKPALTSHGLCFVQVVHNTPGYASVETIILHESGESLSCGITSAPIGKLNKEGVLVNIDAQSYGAALTYSRRFSLSAAFGVCPEDDDGNEACRPTGLEKAKEKSPTYQEEASPFEEEDYKPLTELEIARLAKRVVSTLQADPSVTCLISEKDMAGYLTHWQTKAPLPCYEVLVKKKSLLSSFTSWQATQVA